MPWKSIVGRAAVLLIGSVTLAPLSAQSASRVTAADWRADLGHMVREMERTHADLYHAISRRELEESVGSLERRLSSRRRDEIVVLARIVASIGDGHTPVATPESRKPLP